MKRFAVVTKDWWLALTSFLLLLTAYHLIFRQFFPTRNNTLGGDYARILPDLLDGYYWYRSNGIFEPFWFTPAFCGGQPALGAPESGFYSVAQLLTFVADPLVSVYATILLFASLGFWGFYLLLRTCFDSSRQAAVLGGALFMFNGFFIHRMMIGHFSFHAVMLIPWMAYFLLRPTRKCLLDTLANGAYVGCLLAYGFYSGMVHLLLPGAFAVLGIAAIHGLARGDSAGFMRRSLVAVGVAIGLSAAKLMAALLYLHNFPRSNYSLPGIDGIWDALKTLFSTLFFSPAGIADQVLPLLDNLQWPLDRQEWEYGVTVVPLLIILAGTAVMLYHIHSLRPRMNLTRWVWLVLLGIVLVLSLALNIYSPGWNAFLKQLPVIKSSIYMTRWFLVYIPLVILASALMLDRISALDGLRYGILAVALAALVYINAEKDRGFYQDQPYQPYTIINAWKAARTGTASASIQNISAFVNANNEIEGSLNRNDMLAMGGSQLACYNPIFGYRLEDFPRKSLHIGSVMDERNGVLNIKNPACYTYPEQNNCTPGDHFTVAQRDSALAFTNYKPYPFRFSPGQKIANLLTLVTLALLVMLLAVILARRFWRTRP